MMRRMTKTKPRRRFNSETTWNWKYQQSRHDRFVSALLYDVAVRQMEDWDYLPKKTALVSCCANKMDAGFREGELDG